MNLKDIQKKLGENQKRLMQELDGPFLSALPRAEIYINPDLIKSIVDQIRTPAIKLLENEVETLLRRNDDLVKHNNELLERARAAEADARNIRKNLQSILT